MSSNKNIFVPKEGAYSGSWRRPAGAAGECGALHIAYRSKLGRLEVIEDGIDFLFELEPIDAGTQHVRSYTVDTPSAARVRFSMHSGQPVVSLSSSRGSQARPYSCCLTTKGRLWISY